MGDIPALLEVASSHLRKVMRATGTKRRKAEGAGSTVSLPCWGRRTFRTQTPGRVSTEPHPLAPAARAGLSVPELGQLTLHLEDPSSPFHARLPHANHPVRPPPWPQGHLCLSSRPVPGTLFQSSAFIYHLLGSSHILFLVTSGFCRFCGLLGPQPKDTAWHTEAHGSPGG